MNTMNVDNILKKINQVSLGIDFASDEHDENMLSKYIDEINSLLQTENLNTCLQQILCYNLGNAYSSLNSIRNRNATNIWLYNNNEHINAIKAYRKCINFETNNYSNKKLILTQCYTNLGNMFSEAGRTIYAIYAWKKALSIDENFGMANGNLGRGLIEYGKNLYDKGHTIFVFKYAYDLLKKSISSNDVYPEARNSFTYYKEFLEAQIGKEILEKKENYRNYFSSISSKEKNYKTWCLTKSFFLNPLNDIYYGSFVAQDIIHLPNMISDIKAPPKYHGLFNEIKQQYVSARYFYYSYLQQKWQGRKHFSDKDNLLVNTFDSGLYGVEHELLRNAYKSLYSILDKIAFFINDYFQLNKDIRTVSFHTIWYERNVINARLEGLLNNPLRGLYYLSKDFHSRDTDYLEVTDDESKKLEELRNCLEHRYVKVTMYENNPDFDFQYDTLAYQITEKDFEKKTEKMLQYAREGIIYLSLAVHINEELIKPEETKIVPIVLGKI